MSEEWKWNKSWPGILLFIVMICIIAAGIWCMTQSEPKEPQLPPWQAAQEQIQSAVTAYQANPSYNGLLPILNATYTNANCSNCSVINISTLLAANDGILRSAPAGLNLSASGNDNCGGNASLGCSNEGSYIWLVNSNGDVYSYCARAQCMTNNSGYQGVWP